MTPTDSQAAAIRAVCKWYNSGPNRPQIFRLFGYAGTGKTTLTRTIVSELGVDRVLYAAFTGKAALVMTRKGTPASTIHSLIYAPRTVNGKLVFQLNLDSPLYDADLLVLDEVSMVGEILGEDLLSFQVPTLVLGDPGQLPPPKGTGYFTKSLPNVMLTEIHRQAAGSPIIKLATMARLGQPIPYGKHGQAVVRSPEEHMPPPNMLLAAEQVICGRNATRHELNQAMKEAAGFTSDLLPTGKGEKIICLRNQRDRGLLNGMFIKLTDIGASTPPGFLATVETENGRTSPAPLHVFTAHFIRDVELGDAGIVRRHKLVDAAWGWAITCHKAQGSQWKNVIVINEGFGRRDDYRRWLYTAITRAEEGLLIIG